ncbi:MAG TPA: hypothetical protein PKA63_09170 [Oligoflexia bacterium]|nr:hypothetical protein [Oligoflexia bacterium]HMP48823.1 hypothetical protein [Oligoflexia bacterium]
MADFSSMQALWMSYSVIWFILFLYLASFSFRLSKIEKQFSSIEKSNRENSSKCSD